ncbi:DNA sulfur modification protein DndB [Endozoicomonas sp. ALC066]|uniref:DNA sulfur modification protein DndB n=1 Tax=Endozoicomonas sp. ALC066 TaxID=3403078 RepID=UPI003BB49D24
MKSNNDEFTLRLPAIRGVQGSRPMYSVNMPMRLVDRFLQLTEESLPPELRAQRVLNKKRAEAIGWYLKDNHNYVIPALTLMLKEDPDVSPSKLFTPAGEEGQLANVGSLNLPMGCKLMVADGQHRRAGIIEALKMGANIEHDTVNVTIYPYPDLKGAQTMFHDINANAKKITGSLLDLYDHKDPWAYLAKTVAEKVFPDRVEMEKGSVGKQHNKLFTLYHIKKALKVFTGGQLLEPPEGEEVVNERHTTLMSAGFLFHLAAQNIDTWNPSCKGDLSWSREDEVCGHSVFLEGVAEMLKYFIDRPDKQAREKLTRLKDFRFDKNDWEGVCVLDGRMMKTREHVLRTAAVLYKHVFEARSMPIDFERAMTRLKVDRPNYKLPLIPKPAETSSKAKPKPKPKEKEKPKAA